MAGVCGIFGAWDQSKGAAQRQNCSNIENYGNNANCRVCNPWSWRKQTRNRRASWQTEEKKPEKSIKKDVEKRDGSSQQMGNGMLVKVLRSSSSSTTEDSDDGRVPFWRRTWHGARRTMTPRIDKEKRMTETLQKKKTSKPQRTGRF